MTVHSALLAGRAAAETLMRATVLVERETGQITFDPDGTNARRETIVVYEGRGKIQSYEGHEQPVMTAGQAVAMLRTRVDVPVGSGPFIPGDRVTVLANPDDPMLEGVSLRIAALSPFKSMATAYRVFADIVLPNSGGAHG